MFKNISSEKAFAEIVKTNDDFFEMHCNVEKFMIQKTAETANGR